MRSKMALSKWIMYLLLGCYLILAALGAALYIGYGAPSQQVITASAASIYWSSPSTCPSCGASNDYYQMTSFTRVSGCTYSYEHVYMSNPNPMCSGTVTIHSPYTEAAQEATCTTPGLSSCVRCSSCGIYQTNPTTTPALGHNYVSWGYNNDATCTEDGTETGICSRCRETTTRVKEGTAIGHSYGSWTTVSSATCTSGGTQRSTCSRCGDVQTRSTSALGHNMRTSSYSATCTSGGYTYNYCTRCSYSYNSNQTSALGHNYGTYTTSKAPTCTATGTETAKCTRCSATTSRTLAALGHSPVTDAAVAATCTTAGKTEGSHCSRCDAVITAQTTVPAIGHDMTYVAETPATITAPGEKEHYVCDTCGKFFADEAGNTELTADDLVIPVLDVDVTFDVIGDDYWLSDTVDDIETVLGVILPCPECDDVGNTVFTLQDDCVYGYTHQDGADNHTGTITLHIMQDKASVAATCTTAGSDGGSECAVCGADHPTDVATEIPALGHLEVTDAAVAATCTTAGKTEGSHCSRCDAVITAQTTVPALGHDYGAYTETVAPTCTDKGTETATCTRCGDVKMRDIAALGHRFGPDATCTEDQTCTVCGAVISAAGGHIAGPEATCTDAQTCSVCGTELAPALGHDFGDFVEVKAPTCDVSGEEAAECSRCGDVVTRATAALGHDLIFVAGSDATETDDGIREHYTCDTCGKHFADETGAEEITDDELRIPAGSGDLEDDKSDSKGMSAWQIVLAVLAVVLLIVIVIVIIARMKRKEKVKEKVKQPMSDPMKDKPVVVNVNHRNTRVYRQTAGKKIKKEKVRRKK